MSRRAAGSTPPWAANPLQGLNHAAFTAIIGAAAGQARLRTAAWQSRLPGLSAALAIAVAAHGAWNALASPAITTLLCNAPAESAACAPAPRLLDLLVSVPVLVAAFTGPLAALLVVLALRDRRSPDGITAARCRGCHLFPPREHFPERGGTGRGPDARARCGMGAPS